MTNSFLLAPVTQWVSISPSMKSFHGQSAVEQLAAYLREAIRSGGLDGEIPGVAQ